MKILVDTSVWVEVLRDASNLEPFQDAVGDGEMVLTRFTQLELLQGCLHEKEWMSLLAHLEDQTYLESEPDDWTEAARIFFDLRRRGLTVRSPIDCCIAQLALRHQALLLHRDRDFETIAGARPLNHRRIDF